MKKIFNKLNKNGLLTIIGMVFFSFLLWVYVMSDTNPKITQNYKNISVKYINEESLTRNNLVVMDPDEVNIDIKMTGKLSDLKKINTSDISATIDLSGYNAGERKIPISVELRNQYLKVEVVDFSPRDTLFNIDKIVTKEIPVELNYAGNLKDGYVIGSTSIKPQSVYVSGPKNWLSDVVKAQVSIDLNDKTKDTRTFAPIKIINDKGEEVIKIDKDPKVVEVEIPILKTAERPIIIDLMDNVPDGYEIVDIEIDPKIVTIKGSNVVREIRNIKTKKIDMNRFLDPDFTNIALEMPEGVNLLNPNQEIKISYVVHEIKEETFKIPKSSIAIKNPNKSINYEIDREGDIKITIRGRKNIIDQLSPNDIYPYVDVESLNPGNHSVDVMIDNIGDGILEVMNAKKVKITIK